MGAQCVLKERQTQQQERKEIDRNRKKKKKKKKKKKDFHSGVLRLLGVGGGASIVFSIRC